MIERIEEDDFPDTRKEYCEDRYCWVEKPDCTWCEEKKTSEEMSKTLYDGGFLCIECDDKRENISGYCSIECQLTGECDESC